MLYQFLKIFDIYINYITFLKWLLKIVFSDQLSEAERDAMDDHHNQSQGLNLKGKQALFFLLFFI